MILTWNCEHLVADIYRRIPKEYFDEIILVDDGSEDETFSLAQRLGIKCFRHEHLGYGGNIKFGLEQARLLGADYMVEIHGDGQYDPSVIPHALEMMREGCDFLLGTRFSDPWQPLRDKMPIIRYLANRGMSFIDRLVLQVPISEFHTGFRVYSRTLVETVDKTHTSNDYLFSFEIIAQARYCNLNIQEINIRCDYEAEHKSISLRRSVVYALQTFATLFYYLLARLGYKTKLFRCRKHEIS